MRYRSTATAALLAACALLLGGCGSVSTGTGGGTGQPTPSGPSGPSGSTGGSWSSLTVIVDGGNGIAPVTWTLTCDPTGGTHPHAAAACQQLRSTPGDPFAETPKGMACSMIYGGDQTARVTGTFEGRQIDTKFARTNGCDVARWQRVSALLVFKGGAGLPR